MKCTNHLAGKGKKGMKTKIVEVTRMLVAGTLAGDSSLYN